MDTNHEGIVTRGEDRSGRFALGTNRVPSTDQATREGPRGEISGWGERYEGGGRDRHYITADTTIELPGSMSDTDLGSGENWPLVA